MGYWDEFDKADKEEAGGSGGVIGNVTVDTGFKVYATGQGNEATFFPTGGVGGDARLAAKRKAEAFAQEISADQPRWAVQIRVQKEGAFSGGNAATWENDRFFVTDTWKNSFKDVVRPALEKFEMALPFTGWARVGFKADPYFEAMGEAGKTDQDQDGNPRFKQVAYITELFASKAEALVAVGESGGTPAVAPAFVPEGWDASDWADIVTDIKEQKEMHGMTNSQVKKMIAVDYEVEISMGDLIKLLK